MAYKSEFQSNNADLQSILNMINSWPDKSIIVPGITISTTTYEDTSYCNVQFGDNIYNYNPETIIDFSSGDKLIFSVRSIMYSYARYATVEIDGDVKAQATTTTPITFEWTIPDNVAAIDIVLNDEGFYGNIIVTTTIGNIGSSSESFIPSNSNKETYKSKFSDNNLDLEKLYEKLLLVDFEYIKNQDGTYTLTDWKKTYNGISSKKLIIPDSKKIVL